MPPLTRVTHNKKASSPLHEGLVGLVEVVRDGDDGKDAGYEAGDARREYETVSEKRGHPHAEAELTGQELAHGPPKPAPRGFSSTLLGLSFSRSSVNGARSGL